MNLSIKRFEPPFLSHVPHVMTTGFGQECFDNAGSAKSRATARQYSKKLSFCMAKHGDGDLEYSRTFRVAS